MLDLDAAIVMAGSDDKDGASSTFKSTFGFHPIMAFLDRGDGTGEALVGVLRPVAIRRNVAADNIAVLDAALDQLPDPTAVAVRLEADRTQPGTSRRSCWRADPLRFLADARVLDRPVTIASDSPYGASPNRIGSPNGGNRRRREPLRASPSSHAIGSGDDPTSTASSR